MKMALLTIFVAASLFNLLPVADTSILAQESCKPDASVTINTDFVVARAKD
jgi:hypothetical protein